MGVIGHRVDKADRRRFEQALLGSLDSLYGFAVSLTRNPMEAEDLVQETCLRAINRALSASPKGNVKAWLFTILRNVWINQQRRRVRGPDFVPLGAESEEREWESPRLTNESERPDLLVETEQARDQVRTAVERLPRVYREVILLRCMEGFSYRQIAHILNCPAGTVMSRLSRARAELRRHLRQSAGDLLS